MAIIPHDPDDEIGVACAWGLVWKDALNPVVYTV